MLQQFLSSIDPGNEGCFTLHDQRKKDYITLERSQLIRVCLSKLDFFLHEPQMTNLVGFAGITELPQSGGFTDDTQMTLFTAEGMISAVGQGLLQMPPLGSPPAVSKEATSMLHQSYLRWLATQQTECRHPLSQKVQSLGWLVSHRGLHRREAPGMTCLSALEGDRIGSRREVLNNSKGCGGVMRVAPAALVVHSVWPGETPDRRAAFAYEIGCVAAAITHSHPAGFQSGGVLAAIISYILSGEELLQAIKLSLDILAKEEDHTETLNCVDLSVRLGTERKAKLSLNSSDKESGATGTPEMAKSIANEIKSIGGGWVGEEALGIALYCCTLAGGDIEAGLVWAVNHSGDSDSTGAIAGNILGALLGVESIPTRWSEVLDMSELVKEVANDLCEASFEWAGESVKSGKYPPLVTVEN